jgi:deazaflavin-dependent oxidoreductase (nitroreductase family)
MLDQSRIEAVKKSEFIYLTTRGRRTGKSHTVELWFAFSHGRVYLSHEGDDTDWMKNIAKNDAVDFRIGSVKFEGGAAVAKGSSREQGKKSLYEKYYGPASQ